jgi:hypothetical protein
MSAATLDGSFPHRWQAEVLAARPAILPARHYVYPRQAEEVERGALEVMVRPVPRKEMGAPGQGSPRTGLRPWGGDPSHLGTWDSTTANPPTHPQSAPPFLATCALGFRDPLVPTGIWSAPSPEEICLVAGGYAYMVDTTSPERFTMIPYRPVLEVRAAVDAGMLLFVGHRSILAWGRNGQAWESEKLSDEGVKITAIENGVLVGKGWHLLTDKETTFALDLRSGARVEGPVP